MIVIRLRQLALLERDRPLDTQIRIGEVHERVRPLQIRTPVRVTRYVYAVPS